MALRNMVPFNRKRGNDLPVRRRRATDPFQQMHEEMDRLFEDFLPDIWRGRSSAETGWELAPDIDVQETGKEIRVTAELPGVEDKDIAVSVENDMLTIRGEKSEESEEKEGEYSCRERRYGSFCRSIPLGAEIDADNAKADFKKGVLTVTLPKVKSAEESRKRIDVKSSQ